MVFERAPSLFRVLRRLEVDDNAWRAMCSLLGQGKEGMKHALDFVKNAQGAPVHKPPPGTARHRHTDLTKHGYRQWESPRYMALVAKEFGRLRHLVATIGPQMPVAPARAGEHGSPSLGCNGSYDLSVQ